MKHTSAGVTLIELMITVVIVSLLAAVAVPSYQSYVRKTQRQSGSECLMEVHRRMQVFHQNRSSFPTTLVSLGYPSTSAPCPESNYRVTLETYDRATAAVCGSTARYQLRASSTEAAQAKDGQLVLGYCNNNDPNLRLIRDRELPDGSKKTWVDN